MPGCRRATVDKDHTKARERLIPAAEARAREVAGQCQPALYARTFSLEMQRLSYQAGLIDYDPDQVPPLPLRPEPTVSAAQAKRAA